MLSLPGEERGRIGTQWPLSLETVLLVAMMGSKLLIQFHQVRLLAETNQQGVAMGSRGCDNGEQVISSGCDNGEQVIAQQIVHESSELLLSRSVIF